MSDLILPPKHINKFLENNLKALFYRYPNERARLEPILRAEVTEPIPPLEEIPLPPAPSVPPMRVLLVCGIGSPLFIQTILNDDTILRESFKVFFFEQNPKFLAWMFQNADLTQVLMFPKTEWFLCETIESVKPSLFIALKPEGVTSVMRNAQALTVDAESSKDYSDYYEALPIIYNETVNHVMHNHGNTADSLQGLEATMLNKEFVKKCPGILDLKNAYLGKTALIVGAGASVDQNLEAIKAINDKVVLICADAAYKPLIKAGIRVDYVASIERLNNYQIPFFEGTEDTGAELVAFPVVHPEVMKAFPGKIRLTYRNYSFFVYFEMSHPKGILKCGGSASHLGIRLAGYMGCRKVLLIGLDSSYEKVGENLYRSHCSDTGYPEWSAPLTIEEFQTKRNHAPSLTALNNLGEPALTNITYYQWVKELAEEMHFLGRSMTFINCSAIGLKIEDVPYQPLLEAAKDLPVIDTLKPVPPKASFSRLWEHKDLLKNVHSWLEAARDGLKESEELLKQEQIDLIRYDLLVYFLNFRFLTETMFVAFVIQCCAREFFELENKWYSFSFEPQVDIPEKVKILKARFELFIPVLEKLIKIMSDEEAA